MITISLCMIVKNEEQVIARCLECTKKIVDEIIIVDTGSIDRTKEICAEYTPNIYDFQWVDDFALARNFSFSKATKDYCMWLDADDIITPENRQILKNLKHTTPQGTNIIMCKYNTAFDTHGNPSFSYYRERIIKRTSGLVWKGAVHEAITPVDPIIYSEFAVNHSKIGPGDPDRNLRIFEKLLEKGNVLNPREQFYYGRELYYHRRYKDAIKIFEKFLEESSGWIENIIDACKILSYCYYKTSNDRNALKSLLRSLEYDEPRAEICCEIGKHFFDRNQFNQAVFWYKTALSRKENHKSGAFIVEDCYGYLPCIQLCVCWYRLGDTKKAIYYNDRAGKHKPLDNSYIKNKKFFQTLE